MQISRGKKFVACLTFHFFFITFKIIDVEIKLTELVTVLCLKSVFLGQWVTFTNEVVFNISHEMGINGMDNDTITILKSINRF